MASLGWHEFVLVLVVLGVGWGIPLAILTALVRRAGVGLPRSAVAAVLLLGWIGALTWWLLAGRTLAPAAPSRWQPGPVSLVRPAPSAPGSGRQTCPACGAPAGPEQRYCGECGAPLPRPVDRSSRGGAFPPASR